MTDTKITFGLSKCLFGTSLLIARCVEVSEMNFQVFGAILQFCKKFLWASTCSTHEQAGVDFESTICKVLRSLLLVLEKLNIYGQRLNNGETADFVRLIDGLQREYEQHRCQSLAIPIDQLLSAIGSKLKPTADVLN